MKRAVQRFPRILNGRSTRTISLRITYGRAPRPPSLSLWAYESSQLAEAKRNFDTIRSSRLFTSKRVTRYRPTTNYTSPGLRPLFICPFCLQANKGERSRGSRPNDRRYIRQAREYVRPGLAYPWTRLIRLIIPLLITSLIVIALYLLRESTRRGMA